MEGITLENFLEKTGLRFRVSNEQRKLIEAGKLTREQAFQQALESGELQKRVDRETRLRDAWFDPDLTLENFEAKTGGQRFRLSRERAAMVQNKVLTREEAFAKTVAERRQELNQTTTTYTSQLVEKTINAE